MMERWNTGRIGMSIAGCQLEIGYWILEIGNWNNGMME
jgi:hypothetical protein